MNVDILPLNSDLAKRFPRNPILTPNDLRPMNSGMRVECLLNPGAFRFGSHIYLLIRVAERPEQSQEKISFPILTKEGELQIMEYSKSDPLLDLSDPRVVRHNGTDFLTTLSHLRLVVSKDGVDFYDIPNSFLVGTGENETYGIEDCRVTKIEGRYYLTYTAVSGHGVGVGLRSTEDWHVIENHGMILPPHNKDCALFEKKIEGKYYAFHRPSSIALGGNYIWLAQSPDLVHWGNNRCIAQTRSGMWDSTRIGAGAAPIHTDKGWLAIYHGADENNRYCLGALLLDLKKPWEVIARSKQPIMKPTTSYEINGFFNEVVFTNGHIIDGDLLTLYYGAADSVICGAYFSIKEILSTLV